MSFNEPFLINPQRTTKGLFKKGKKYKRSKKSRINSKSNKPSQTVGSKSMAKRRKTYHRKHARKNPLSSLMLIGNPRKSYKRAGHHRLSVSGRSHALKVSRHSRLATGGSMINPILPKMAAIKPVIVNAIGVTAGFVGTRMAVKFLNKSVIPVAYQTGVYSYIVKAGVIVVGSYAVGKVTKSAQLRQSVMVGGIVSVLYDLILAYAPSIISAYQAPSFNLKPGISAYQKPGSADLSNDSYEERMK